MNTPQPSRARRSTRQLSGVNGAGMRVCALFALLTLAILATSDALANDVQDPRVATAEGLEATHHKAKALMSSPATAAAPNTKETPETQAPRALESANDKWPDQTLDLGLCDGS